MGRKEVHVKAHHRRSPRERCESDYSDENWADRIARRGDW